MTALEKLGASIASGDRLSPTAFADLKLHIVDTVGAWIAGMGTPEGRALLRFAARGPRRGRDIDSAAADVTTHCALARLSEIDDIHLPSMTTPGAIVIPSALVLAASLGTTKSLGQAILGGYDAMMRLGLAVQGPVILYRGIWPTYFGASFGVAAVTARLMELNEQQTAHALACALTLAAPGVGHHNAATTTRWLAVGNAARNGVTAARAARAGFTSDLNLLDGRFLPEVYNVAPNQDVLTRRLARNVLADVSFKPWCAARQTMAATQGLKEIIDSGVPVADIAAIEVGVVPPHLKMIDHDVTAGDRASHLTSLSYQMASAVLDSATTCDVGRFSVPRAVRALMNRIKVTADENLLAYYPKVWPARVLVVTHAGAIHERMIEHIPGDPARAFQEPQVRQKFRHFVALVLGEAGAEKTADLAFSVLDDDRAPVSLLDAIERTGTSCV
jgi:2-methylcitrate dehydratase PrpD